MAIDLAAAISALYDLLRADAAGDAARDLLGVFPGGVASPYGGTAAVFPGFELGRLAGSGVTYPWAVWRPLPIGGASRSIRAVQGTWWLYVAPNAGIYRLYTVATAIEALYNAAAGLTIAYGRCRTTVGAVAPDSARGGAQTLAISISYEALG